MGALGALLIKIANLALLIEYSFWHILIVLSITYNHQIYTLLTIP